MFKTQAGTFKVIQPEFFYAEICFKKIYSFFKLPIYFLLIICYNITSKTFVLHNEYRRLKSMLINYISKNVNLKDNFKVMVEKKVSKFDRLFGDSASATVKVAVLKNRQRVEITISNNGMIYRSECTTGEMNDAVDKCIAILGRQIRKNKTKLGRRIREGSIDEFIASELEAAADVDESDDVDYDVYRIKKIPMKPMNVDEAILRMNMVDHQFFMFTNADSGQINVVYKRDDGRYGLLEPDED